MKGFIGICLLILTGLHAWGMDKPDSIWSKKAPDTAFVCDVINLSETTVFYEAESSRGGYPLQYVRLIKTGDGKVLYRDDTPLPKTSLPKTPPPAEPTTEQLYGADWKNPDGCRPFIDIGFGQSNPHYELTEEEQELLDFYEIVFPGKAKGFSAAFGIPFRAATFYIETGSAQQKHVDGKVTHVNASIRFYLPPLARVARVSSAAAERGAQGINPNR